MRNYTTKFKQNIVRRMLLKQESVLQIARDTGISVQTLYQWKRKFQDKLQASDYKRMPEEWSLAERHEAVLLARELGDEKRGEYLRKAGLKAEHIEIWTEEIREALQMSQKASNKEEEKKYKKKIKELEKDLLRKDKALAEMTALLVLKKKLAHILEREE